MSKLLTIGASYSPNTKVGVDNNGKPIFQPLLKIYFNCDAKTANLVAAAGVAKDIKPEGDALVRFLNPNDLQKFIYGKKAFPNILAALEKFGDYVYDTSNLNQLEAQIEQTINDVVSSSMSSKLQIDRNAYIDDILTALEQNFNDPNFMQYLNSIGSIRRLDPNDLEKIISFSAFNNAMILTQWLKTGHQGEPRFMATAAQWRVFNRQPVNGASPIYAMCPAGTTHTSKTDSMNHFGIDRNTFNTNAMARLVVQKGMNDKNYGETNNNPGGKYIPEGPYYDYSETELIQGMVDNYDFDAIANNKAITNINSAAKKEDDTKRFDMLKPKDGDTTKFDVKTLLTNISNFAAKVGDTALEQYAKGGNLNSCVSYLVDQSETIKRLRGKNYTGWNRAVQDAGNKKKIYADLTKALVFMRFGINMDDAKNLIANNMNTIKTRTGGFNKNVFNAIISDFQNIYFIMAGLAEDSGNDLFMWALNALGLSVEEYKAMPNTEEEALSEFNEVKKTFINNFNKLLS